MSPGSLRYAKPTLGGGDRDLAGRNSWSGHMVVAVKIWRDNAEPRDILHTPKMGSDWPVMACMRQLRIASGLLVIHSAGRLRIAISNSVIA